jgi:hypothetical protein
MLMKDIKKFKPYQSLIKKEKIAKGPISVTNLFQ